MAHARSNITRLDIVVPTYNRSKLLTRTLSSIAAANATQDFSVGVIVVDNNSTDDTKATVESFRDRLPDLRYILETKQGRSHALNAGILASSANLIGMIDDDEEIHPDWIVEIASNFRKRSIDFLGGPCLPNWGEHTCPNWVPRSHGGLIGWIVPSDEDFDYGPQSHAYMVGGNAVVRRCLLQDVGLYHTGLGRTKTNANGGEDLEMFNRLMAANAKGHYASRLIIYHHIPIDRLDRGFFRKRSFWDGVSLGYISRTQPEPVPHIAGIPRNFLRLVAEGVLRRLSLKQRAVADSFADELRFVEFFGRAYGRYLYSGR